MKPIFITGIGTGIGKTVVSSVVVESLRADYWKPVQSGDLDSSDTDKVRSLVSNPVSCFHPEAYRLTQPFSPHKSADLDGVTIRIQDMHLPATDNQLVVEGAGGLMVPLNDTELIVDLIEYLEAEVILVANNYLGSINHTILSINELKRRAIPIRALVFNGQTDSYSESFIINYSKIKDIFRIPEMSSPDRSAVAKIAGDLKF